MSKFLLESRDGPILTLTMNRPESRNALTDPDQMMEFVDVCAAIRKDHTIRCVILTGAGPGFCAGGNVKDMQNKSGMFGGAPFTVRNNYRDQIQRIPLALYELEVPVIAAINGAAVGAGLDLACMCDIRIAADTAVFAESFVKLGIVPGDGGAWLLPRVIGMPRATLLALTGDSINAQQALEWQLVTSLSSPESLMADAMALAKRVATNPSHGLRMTKRLLREGQHVKLDTLLELSAAFQALAHHTEDHHEAVAAMLEKRPARYEDR